MIFLRQCTYSIQAPEAQPIIPPDLREKPRRPVNSNVRRQNSREYMLMNYRYEVQLSATPEAIFEALSTSKGIAGWWAKSNRLWKDGDQELLSLDFGQVKKLLRALETNPSADLTWHVLECTLQEWPGTRIIFNIMPVSEMCSLLKLEHEGLTPQLECFESCSFGWEYFMVSLKGYVETGVGTPR